MNIYKRKYLKYKKKYLNYKNIMVGGKYKSVSILLLARDNRNNLYRGLVHRRNYNDGNGSGKVAIPGGMIDPGEKPACAVIRELEEEAGIVIKEENINLLSYDEKHIIYYCKLEDDLHLLNVNGPMEEFKIELSEIPPVHGIIGNNTDKLYRWYSYEDSVNDSDLWIFTKNTYEIAKKKNII